MGPYAGGSLNLSSCGRNHKASCKSAWLQRSTRLLILLTATIIIKFWLWPACFPKWFQIVYSMDGVSKTVLLFHNLDGCILERPEKYYPNSQHKGLLSGNESCVFNKNKTKAHRLPDGLHDCHFCGANSIIYVLWLQPQNPSGIIELVWEQDPTLQHFLIREMTVLVLTIPPHPK